MKTLILVKYKAVRGLRLIVDVVLPEDPEGNHQDTIAELCRIAHKECKDFGSKDSDRIIRGECVGQMTRYDWWVA